MLSTGRHLVLLRHGLGTHGARILHNVAGLHVGLSSDWEGSAGHPHLSPGEGLLFHQLGAAVVQVDPDQVAALGTHICADVEWVEAERFVKPRNIAGELASASKAQASWGLQTAGVLASRFTGRGVRVAILDTGIDLQHPDFLGRAIVSQSLVAGAAVNDSNGHGTYCAGIVCGPLLPAQPPRYGVAPDAELYVGKVVGDDGTGADGNILAGIDWAARNGCAVVSLSVGTPVARGEPYSPIYEQVAQRALAAGSLLMAAAGNDSVRPDTIAPVDHPANCPSILAIAAVDAYLRIAPFSCGGVNADGGDVGFAAPGVAVRSSWPRPALYRSNSGTSLAAACAAGIAALLAEANPGIRGSDLLDLLARSAQPLALPARDVGAGLIRAP